MKRRFVLLSDTGERGLLVINLEEERYIFSYFSSVGQKVENGKILIDGESEDRIILISSKGKFSLIRRWRNIWTLSDGTADNLQIFEEKKKTLNLLHGRRQ